MKDLERLKKWEDENKEHIREVRRKWRAANQDKVKAARERWKAKHGFPAPFEERVCAVCGKRFTAAGSSLVCSYACRRHGFKGDAEIKARVKMNRMKMKKKKQEVAPIPVPRFKSPSEEREFIAKIFAEWKALPFERKWAEKQRWPKKYANRLDKMAMDDYSRTNHLKIYTRCVGF